MRWSSFTIPVIPTTVHAKPPTAHPRDIIHAPRIAAPLSHFECAFNLLQSESIFGRSQYLLFIVLLTFVDTFFLYML